MLRYTFINAYLEKCRTCYSSGPGVDTFRGGKAIHVPSVSANIHVYSSSKLLPELMNFHDIAELCLLNY